jgi:hypothetical protein
VNRGSVQPIYRRTGKGRWSWARHNGGRHSRDKVAERVLDGSVVRARRAWVDSGQGRAISSWAGQGLSWRCPLVQLTGVGYPAVWQCFSAGRSRIGEGREERGKEGPGFKLNFLKILNRNLKNSKQKVVGNLKIYNFYFSPKFI